MSTSKRMKNNLSRDLYVLEDESNPRSTQVDTIWPSTILDQVFDNLSPTQKSLRQILEDLRVEIITGGRGNIIFPVTSVNGMTDDVILTKKSIGLGNVDNTRDIDKPLSIPQRTAVSEMLSTFDFHVNLDDLYRHLTDSSNPHDVSITQLDSDNELTQFVKNLISSHNFSRDHSVHMDIRNSLSRLWTLVENIDGTIEDRISTVLQSMNTHREDPNAHVALFEKKEDRANKVNRFTQDKDCDNTKYPSTKAVDEFVANRIRDFRATLPEINDWIDDVFVTDSRQTLPAATSKYSRKMAFIRKGRDSHPEIAICRPNPDGYSFSWDYSSLGSYSKFDPAYFIDTPIGMSLNMGSVLDAMISENGMLDSSLSEILSHYYTSEQIDSKKFLQNVTILPGTVDGTIRYYFDDHSESMSGDIRVAGLKRLAYLEWVTENEVADNAIFGRHIMNRAIERRHLQEHVIGPEHMIGCRYGYIMGNTMNKDNTYPHEVPLTQLAELLRPLIGGWPDPSVPGGNPWVDVLEERLIHHHKWTPGVEYPLHDSSYAMRFTGEISSTANMDVRTVLSEEITLGAYQIIDAGGTWQYQSDPDEWTILGGSNITGHTFATVNMTKVQLELETISIGDRKNARYDIWVKYVKTDEMNQMHTPS